MSFSKKFITAYKALLPSPFTIAIVLSFFVFGLAYFFGELDAQQSKTYTLLTYWQNGLWNTNLLAFSVQMMLMLVLGHMLALSTPVNAFIEKLITPLTTTASAAAVISLTTMVVGLFNWGLGLVFGAIFARKMAEHANKHGLPINYPLLAACGYAGMMVWHGGLSGSSLAKVTEIGHLQSLTQNTTTPSAILFDQTVFSHLNITATILLLTVIPTVMFLIGKTTPSATVEIVNTENKPETPQHISGAERMDHSKGLARTTALIILAFLSIQMNQMGFFKFFTLNNINLLLFGLTIGMHGTFAKFLNAADEAISGATGILIQFPFYFGIMGMMNSSGLITQFSAFLTEWASPDSFAFVSFLGAGVVNILVPSGGGQWAIQGGLIVETAIKMGADLPKAIMAFAYGDQLTNMLQPFWAVPLLGITQLKAKQILPYTLVLFLMGFVIFSVVLFVF